MQAFIDDGYTRTVGFKEVPNVRPALEFTYRPFAGDERNAIKGRLLTGDSNAGEDFKKEMATRISRWNLDRDVTVENLNKLNASLFESMANVLLGFQAPDYETESDGLKSDQPLADADQEDVDLKN